MNNLAQRAVTSVIGASVLIFAMVWNEYSLIAVLYIISLLVHIEYLRKTKHFNNTPVNSIELILNILIGFIVFWCQPFFVFLSGITSLSFPGIFLFQTIPIIGVIFIYELFSKRENPLQNISANVLGIIYCVIPFLLLYDASNQVIGRIDFMHISHNGNYFVLGYFLLMWTYDVMAYFTGRFLGRHKLMESISPKKTWEGFFGGTIFSIGGAILISNYFLFLTTPEWVGIALIISVFGTLGDLAESMLKRSLQLKDSSNILPGHGGFLDRFDGTLIAAPFVWLFICILNISDASTFFVFPHN